MLNRRFNEVIINTIQSHKELIYSDLNIKRLLIRIKLIIYKN